MASEFEPRGNALLPDAPIPVESWPELLRAEVQLLLDRFAPGAFLRRARGEALFVTDAARRSSDIAPLEKALSETGWRTQVERELLHISPAPEKLRPFDAIPAEITPFLRGFCTFCGREADTTTVLLFSEGVKLCAVRSGAAAIAAYEKRIRQQAALVLRTGGGGGLFACARMIDHLTRRLEP